MIRITVTSVFVDDQAKALAFYTDVLGFVVKHDIPLGGDARWLTVVSPAAPDGVELLLEPSGHPAVGPFRAALVEDLHVHPERMRANLHLTRGLIASERAGIELSRTLGHAQARRTLEEAARRVASEEIPLADALGIPDLDPADYLGAATALVDAALNREDAS